MYSRPPFDPELAAILATYPQEVRELGWLGPADIPAYREMNATVPGGADAAALRRDGAVEIEERTVPGPAGAPEISLLIMRPTRGAGSRPCVYHTHGGGMISGNKWELSHVLAEWVDVLGIVGISVEYRLAPEHPHPAPVEDCYAGLAWVAANADELSIDPERLIIWGTSAGGGLAAATALLARDRGGPALAHQMLQAPMLDDRCQTASSQELDREGFWDSRANLTAWTCLLGQARGGPEVSPYAAPARAADLSGLPATYIDTGQVDTFRDETIDYAARLSRSGVPVELHVWPGAWHAFATAAPQAAVSQLAIAARTAYLQRVLDY
ncbi:MULTISPECIES: alpha/beta hydrolase [unclassified Kitasatospora]|uniref:alpha/beta hydrolase n=1 Tax=unclassified Kitasatospora TaxID=2633591 RepID=UPI0034131DCF